MSRKITLGTIAPEELNLNGDQANLQVLEYRLKLRGVESETITVDSGELAAVDLVFLGHGSIAAWEFVLNEQAGLLDDLVTAVRGNKKIMAVASGALKLLEALGQDLVPVAHRSEFVEENGLVGYLNSSVSGLETSRINSAWFTQLHGPVFAKNPEFADRLCLDYGWVETLENIPELNTVDALAAESRRIAFEH